MAKKKSPRKRLPVPAMAANALSRMMEPVEPVASVEAHDTSEPRESGTRESRPSGVFEELYASELRRRAETLVAEVAPPAAPANHQQVKEAESGPKLTAKAQVARDDAREARAARVIEEDARDARAATAAAVAAAEDQADDTSIPPVDVEAEQFFAKGESAASLPHLWGGEAEHEELDEPHADHVRRASPAVLARRAKLRRVTQRVVGVLALIALVGLGKAVLTGAPSAELPLQSVAHAAAALPQAAQPVQEAPKAPPPVVNVAVNALSAAAIPPPEPLALEERVAEPLKAEEPTAKPADPAAPASDAKADKKAAQHAIDRGDNKGAVEAGERALEADPTDAETWLIVGAAYQQMGQGAKAHKAFSSCASKSTHGPKGECAALR